MIYVLEQLVLVKQSIHWIMRLLSIMLMVYFDFVMIFAW